MADVLDHGQVLLIDSMASDQKVVGSARVSTGKGPEYTSKGLEADSGLIKFLMENGHGTPFEHSVFQFFVKAPIFVVREWQRHRVASYNEQSGRYSEFKPEFYVPDHVRVPDPKNRQGAVRVEGKDYSATMLQVMAHSAADSFAAYDLLLRGGMAREMARMVLPLNMYTSFWFTINARSLMNFLMLRGAEAAQWEIRMFELELEKIFGELMPITHEWFLKNGRVAP